MTFPGVAANLSMKLTSINEDPLLTGQFSCSQLSAQRSSEAVDVGHQALRAYR
jgi:hypothetical protein